MVLCAALLAGTAWAQERTPAPEGASVYIIAPKNGETVPQTFKVQFGLSATGVAPAGAELPKTGHHHLLVDMDELPPMDQPIRQDIKHVGGGETAAEIALPLGQYTLQLVLGDKNQVPFDPPLCPRRSTSGCNEARPPGQQGTGPADQERTTARSTHAPGSLVPRPWVGCVQNGLPGVGGLDQGPRRAEGPRKGGDRQGPHQ